MARESLSVIRGSHDGLCVYLFKLAMWPNQLLSGLSKLSGRLAAPWPIALDASDGGGV